MGIRMYDLISKKKKNESLTKEEIFAMIEGYTKGEVPDYQMSALMMAICFNSMTDDEIFNLTEAMAVSGDTVDLSCFGDKSVDKHSTGGVGDKTTLIVAPIVAACGGIVAKMSGRGLGHTGGTIDKLESFDGFKTTLSQEDFVNQVKAIKIAVIGQSGDLAPADKKLYALRDVTCTIDSIPLIASSIMSKKLAAGTKNIVLDVKCGSGAFMRTAEDASRLAELMVKIGKAHGRNITAVITNMDLPLGHGIGNVLEVTEAIEVLKCKGPDDLKEICLTLASIMVMHSCKLSFEEAKAKAEHALNSGEAYKKFCSWIKAQGGNEEFALNPEKFGIAKYQHEIKAETDGYISHCNAEKVGTAAMILGAGRKTADDVIDVLAGIKLYKKTGDKVNKGDVIATLYTEKQDTVKTAEEIINNAITFQSEPTQALPLIYNIVGL